jgi:membrane protease subunit HflK
MSGRDIRGVPTPPQFRPPDIKLGRILSIVLVLILLALGWSMVFQVEPEEVGVVLTFGAYSREASPGLNFKLPFPIQTVIKVPVQRQLKQEFGFETVRPGRRTVYSERNFEEESLMLTGDLNVAEVAWITQYRIDNPYLALFKVRNAEETLRDMNEAVMRAVIGDRSVNEVLTVGRQEIASEVELRLQELCDLYENGIRIDQVVLQDVTPPEQVKNSFNEVNQAQQERERMINEALAEKNRVVPRARGEAQQAVQEAEGYATDRVNRAQGDAALFESVLASYRRAPDVTRRRIYLETMQQVLPGIERKVVLDKDLEGILPLLNLDGKGGAP